MIQKANPNSFLDTTLEAELRARGVEHVVVCGMMTSMCVDATVRAAVDLGFEATVAHDACATCDLEFAGETIPARQVHGAFVAALGDGYAALGRHRRPALTRRFGLPQAAHRPEREERRERHGRPERRSDLRSASRR